MQAADSRPCTLSCGTQVEAMIPADSARCHARRTAGTLLNSWPAWRWLGQRPWRRHAHLPQTQLRLSSCWRPGWATSGRCWHACGRATPRLPARWLPMQPTCTSGYPFLTPDTNCCHQIPVKCTGVHGVCILPHRNIHCSGQSAILACMTCCSGSQCTKHVVSPQDANDSGSASEVQALAQQLGVVLQGRSALDHSSSTKAALALIAAACSTAGKQADMNSGGTHTSWQALPLKQADVFEEMQLASAALAEVVAAA